MKLYYDILLWAVRYIVHYCMSLNYKYGLFMEISCLSVRQSVLRIICPLLGNEKIETCWTQRLSMIFMVALWNMAVRWPVTVMP